jgi:hypothetical protein
LYFGKGNLGGKKFTLLNSKFTLQKRFFFDFLQDLETGQQVSGKKLVNVRQESN